MKTITRLILGATLPVLLYCLGFFGVILIIEDNKSIDSVSEIFIMILASGYIIMGIPSIVYSVIMEYLSRKYRNNTLCIARFGSIFGLISGSVVALFSAEFIVFISMGIPGAIIGFIIPYILKPLQSSFS
ncbi:MAG: hypothetical protein AAF212_08275 [Verrucomicrobiota bacterium]